MNLKCFIDYSYQIIDRNTRGVKDVERRAKELLLLVESRYDLTLGKS